MPYVRLSDICTLKQWKALPARCFTTKGYPVYGANGIIGYYHSYNHEQPVIAITCRGDSCGTVRITEPQAYITANAICTEEIRADILPKYLYYYLKHTNLAPYISGAAQPQITQHNLGKLPIPLVPIEQQRYIAERLDKVEHIIALSNRQLKDIEDLKNAYFSQELAAARLHDTCREYKLGDIAHIHCGKKNASAACADGKYPFFSCAKTPLRINDYSYDCECLLISGNIDFNLTYYNGRFDAYQRIYIIESRDASQWQIPYLHACLRQYLPSLKHQSVGGVIKYIRRPMLTELCVPIPDTATQQRIGKVTLQLQSMEQELRSAVSQHEKLFSSLLHRFFARFTAVS